MTDDPTCKPNHGGIVAALLLLPVFYVLSFAPVIKFSHGYLRHSPLRQIYYPVIWLHYHTVLRKPLEEYLKLWGI